MWLTIFGFHSNLNLNTVQLTVSKVIIFHENMELLPPGKSYEVSAINIDITEGINAEVEK